MAVKKRGRGVWWSRFHFLIRFAGLTGLVAAGAGIALAYRNQVLTKARLTDVAWLQATLQGEGNELYVRIAVTLLAAGAAVAALALLFELLALTSTALGRRGAFGFNATLQVVLAAALVVGFNWFSFQHYLRLDWTRHHQFTLPAELQEQLRELKGATTIVVLERHEAYGRFNDKPDAYDSAAGRKVVEKVHDIVDQFREFGAQFQVRVLDAEDEQFKDKLDPLAEANPGLREAVDGASQSTIFFCAGGRVQQLGFKDFYYLNKNESKKDENLVMLDQGVEPFARKVLNVDEKRPKVGIFAIHEWLTTQSEPGIEDYGLGGLKKTLAAQGFIVEDIILKKWSEMAGPEPAVYSFDESKLDRIEEDLADFDNDIKGLNEDLADLTKAEKQWRTSSLEELTKTYAKQLGGRKIDEVMRKRQLEFVEQNILFRKAILTQLTEDRASAQGKKGEINVEQATERRRMKDLKAKLARTLADCDLVIIPRMTIRNLVQGDRIPSFIHRLDAAQLEALKGYLAGGKPLLACLGPTSEPPTDRMREMQMGGGGPDDFEGMLTQLGFKLNKQTILYNAESKSFAERRTGFLVSGGAVEVPPVEFERLPNKADAFAKEAAPEGMANPIRAGMEITADSLGRKIDLRLPHPRPVYFEPPAGEKSAFEPVFMITSPATWNDDQPFPSRERTPRFELPKADDPVKGTVDEKRRGPFPVGVAAVTQVPLSWYAYEGAKAAQPRVAIIGSGGIFVGPKLTPAKEELLLDTCNWLLGRDDLLPKADVVWKYPHVRLAAEDQTLWHCIGWFVLPGLFAYFGLIVLLARRLR